MPLKNLAIATRLYSMVITPNPCFILHQWPYKESSLILEIFSREYGRVSLVAKGVKRKKSRYAGLLNLYWKLLLSWQGKSDLMTLTSVEIDCINDFSNNSAIFAGFYINELIMRLLHKNEPHTDLFAAYDNAVSSLSGTNDLELILRIFEKNLLKSLGYGIVLDHEILTGKEIREDCYYYFHSDHGPVLNRPESSDYIKVSGKTLFDFNNDNFSDKNSMNEAKALMRYILHKYLDGRPLESRDLYKSYLTTTRSDL